MAVWLAEPIFAMNQLHATPLQLGLMGMANGGGYALLAVAAGWISDRTGRRRWMLVGIASQIVILMILPHCRQVGWFIALAATHTTLLALFWPPFMSLFSETLPQERLSRALGRYNISWCLGGIIGSALSGRLYDRLGPAAPFHFGALVVFGTLLVHLCVHPGAKVPHETPHTLERPRVAALMRQAWLLLIGNFFVVSLLMYLFPKLAETPRFSLGATFITSLHGLRMGAMLLTFAAMGATAHWHFRQWPVHVCFVLMLGMLALTALAEASWFFVIPFAFFGVTTGIAYGLSAYYSMLAPAGKGVLVGIHEMFLSSGSTLGPIFGGFMVWASGRPEAPFWAGLAPLALFWLLCVRLVQHLTLHRPASITTA